MAVTRIKNNQITDSTIVANAKVVDYSISASKLANNLTYGSDLTISGNLTVNGSTTTVDTINTLIEDPILVLADGQTSGTPVVDIGILGYRGNQNSSFIGWKESATTFMAILSNTTVSNTTVNVTSYANFTASTITAQANLSVIGNIVGNANFSGNLTAGNILTPGLVSATANITGGNVLTGGLVSATGNITTAGALNGATLSLSGNVTSALNITGNVTGGNFLTPGLISATSTITSAANITGGNVLTGGLISATSTITSAANVIGGNLTTGGQVSATANITGGNILTGGLISAGGNITSATNVNTPNVVGATGMTISTGSGDLVLSPSGNINASNNYINNLPDPVLAQDAASKQYVDDSVSAGLTIHTPVLVESPTALNGTYAQGGTTATVTSTVAGNTVVFSSAISPQVNDQYWFTSAFSGILANTPYFVVSAPNTSAAVLSTSYSGAPVANITSATGLTQPVRINSGVGATLTNAGANATLTIDGVTLSNTNRVLVYTQANAVHNGVYTVTNAGNGTSAWQLTRSTDADVYGPKSTDELDVGDYFYVQSGSSGAGESYVMTAPTTAFIIGYNNLTFTQFNASQVYTANTSAGLSLVGTVFSAKVDGVTTAFDGGGNISVKVSANLTTPNIGAATGTSLSVTGAVNAGTTISATGNITGGNILGGANVNATTHTGTTVSVTANITGGNVLTGGLISSTGNITTAGALNGATLSLSGNVTSALNITGNVTGGNLLTPGLISATANITGGNVLTGGLISSTGNATHSNLILTSGFIDGPASGRVTINGSDIDTDFAVDGDTVANVFYVDAGTGTASFGNSTQTTNAVVAFNASTSVKMPVGNTAQRPATGVTGMIRFNTNNNALEIYDNAAWTDVGVPVFTVIADEQFNGDGVTVAFTLGSSQTTNSCIVSINGVVQIPTSAYSVSGTTLTFTEAPASGDLIDVREITTTTTVTSISNSSGNAVIAVSPTSAQTNVTGDLSVSGSILGGNLNSTAITFGTSNMTIISSGGNIRANIGGTTVQTISPGLVAITGDLSVSGNATLSGNILGDRIQNGTTSFDIQTASGNANINIGGTGNLAVFAPGNLLMTGNITPTANITYDLGTNTNRWKDIWLANSTIYLGNSQISANATSLIFTNPSGGQTVLAGASAGITGATVSASGNITGGNILTGGLISATSTITSAANVIGGNLTTGGQVSATGNITGGNVSATNLTGTLLTAAQTNITSVGTLSSLTVTANVQGGNLRTAGLISATGAITGAALTGTSLTVSTGNITGGNLILSGAIQDSGQLDIQTTASNSNIVLTPNGTGNVNISGNIMPTANATANIGSATSSFNTIFAKATSAQYADLAEKYTADAEYAPGTVVAFGGTHEVTLSTQDADRRVAGVVSTNPSYIMNGGLEGANIATVALTGRVPTLVTGAVAKGDLMVSNGDGTARAEADPRAGAIIGKALEDFAGGTGTIEVVIGRF